MISKRDHSYMLVAQVEALNSPCRTQHGAIAVSSGKIIGRGYNDYKNRTKTPDGQDEIGCTCHAEMAAIKDVLKTFGYHQNNYTHDRRVDKIFNKTKIYIARTNIRFEYKESSPCKDCLNVMKRLSIKKIIHTIDDGINVIDNVKEYNTNHKSNARRYLDRKK